MRTAHSKLELRGKNRVYFAECPEHGKELKNGEWKGERTTTLRAQQIDMSNIRWDVWRCDAKEGHLFNAVPAIMPSTPAEWRKWEKAQLAEREAKAKARGA